MLPEWGLLIFMEKFCFNRGDAIKQLEDQNRARVAKKHPLNLEL